MTTEKNKKIIWCKLNNKPCIHPQSDDLENCRYCEEYDIIKYLYYGEKYAE